jgi:hypothetical protein
LTGTGPFTTLTLYATTDGLAHLVSLTSAANISALTATLVGTDADGQAQTEAVTCPNATTVYSTKYFKTLVSITMSATLGANTMDVGIQDVSISQTIPINYAAWDFNSTQMVEVTGTINYTVQYTEGAIYDRQPSMLPWFNHATLAAKTASLDGAITSPFRALRLKINSLTAGATAVLTHLQGA